MSANNNVKYHQSTAAIYQKITFVMQDNINISSINIANIDYLNRVLLRKKMTSTKIQWSNDTDVQNWLKERQITNKWSAYDVQQQVIFWYNTVENIGVNKNGKGTWTQLPDLPTAMDVKKTIKYIQEKIPKETWGWKLGSDDGDVYLNWWSYMRRLVTLQPELLKKYFLNDTELPTNAQEQERKAQEQQRQQEGQSASLQMYFIYPTLDKWTRIFTSGASGESIDYISDGAKRTLDIESLNTATKAQDVILAIFAQWLVLLANDRQMFTNENIYNPGIPRIQTINGKEIVRLDLYGNSLNVNSKEGKIETRDYSVVFLLKEGSKILYERGIATDSWFDINKNYTWLLHEI